MSESKSSCSPHLWIICAFASSIVFTISNAAKTQLAAETGTVAIMYNSIGQLVTSLVYMISTCIVNYKTRKVCWAPQNLIVDG